MAETIASSMSRDDLKLHDLIRSEEFRSSTRSLEAIKTRHLEIADVTKVGPKVKHANANSHSAYNQERFNNPREFLVEGRVHQPNSHSST
jgi:hypothetical protein